MAQSAPARTKINTKVTQPAPGRPSRRPAGRPGPGRPPRGPRVSGEARESVRRPDRPVIELESGILVYPPETGGEPWRAVFTENGQRKYRQGATEAKLAAKLEKVRERLQADAANMERPGAALIKHYLDPDRLPAGERWSRKHAHTQRRLCERFAGKDKPQRLSAAFAGSRCVIPLFIAIVLLALIFDAATLAPSLGLWPTARLSRPQRFSTRPWTWRLRVPYSAPNTQPVG
jgi:hypothetical protein